MEERIDCKLHPGTPSIAACEECGTPICHTCRAKRYERPLCYPCSWEHEGEAAPLPDPEPGIADHLVTLPDGPGARGAAGDAIRYTLAFFITGGAATLMGLAWWKFVTLLGHDYWLYGVFAAGVVGMAARLSYGGRRGCMLMPLGALMGAYTVMLHHLMLVQDDIRTSPGGVRFLDSLSLAERVVPLVQAMVESLTFYGWVLVLGGAMVGGVIPFLTRPFGPAITLPRE